MEAKRACTRSRSQREKEAWQANRCSVNHEDDRLLELPFLLRPCYGIFPKAVLEDNWCRKHSRRAGDIQ